MVSLVLEVDVYSGSLDVRVISNRQLRDSLRDRTLLLLKTSYVEEPATRNSYGSPWETQPGGVLGVDDGERGIERWDILKVGAETPSE